MEGQTLLTNIAQDAEAREKLISGKCAAMTLLEQALEKNDFQYFAGNVMEKMGELSYNENDLKNVLEAVFRQVLLNLLNEQADLVLLERMFKFSINAAVSGICSSNIPVLIITDMWDGSTLDNCEKIFTFMENSADIFKTGELFKVCKNQLLRSCNDLLRRLSRAQNTVFCGRILLFLARIFPFSERSGLNVISEFNLDNTTKICSMDDAMLETKRKFDEPDSTERNKRLATVDYNLYRKFWCLQEYFRNPPICYNKLQWRQFTTYASEVLTIFGSFKAEAMPSLRSADKFSSTSGHKEFAYFAKFLTSPKLLELELGDSDFRRCVLIQFLILFQYLMAHVKFKLDTYTLTEEQITWIRDTEEKIFKYIEKTPPDGKVFCATVKKLLSREEFWNKWKNEGCPNFKTPGTCVEIPQNPKERLGDILRPGKVYMGNPELDRLWSICPDNWEACRSPKRKFLPSLEKYFENAIKQADPANKVPPEEKDVSDPNFCWKGLLLLSKKSPCFFSVNNTPYKTAAEYLEATILKIPKESSSTDVLNSSEPLTQANFDDGSDEMLQTHDGDSSPKEEEPDTTEQESSVKSKISS